MTMERTSGSPLLRLAAAVLAMLPGLLVPLSAPARAETSGPFGLGNLFASPSQSSEEDEAKAKREELAKQEAALLDELTPTDLFVSLEAAQRLADAIASYQQIVSAGGWPLLPKVPTLRPGDQDESVPLVRRRLQISGDMPAGKSSSWDYDEAIQAGIKHFQRRHGIPPNGVLDRRTFYALNVPAMDRLQQLRINLQRLQDMARQGLPDRYVMVNVPAQELQAIDDGRIALKSRVIVGRIERPTPTVAAKIVGLNFFPYWRVPESVAYKDLIPKLGKDPEYLTREHIRVLTDWNGQEIDPHAVDWSQPQFLNLRFRQDPGEFNALGLVRVDMPNPDNVYMHDTPMKDLFRRSARAYSAGCVRVQRILDLVAWLAGTNGDWDRARVDSVLTSGLGQDVKLAKAINVYFIYQTAWVDTELGVAFRNDIYGRDGVEDTARGDREEREQLPVQSLAP